MRILSVSDDHRESILRRRAACVAKIARQRDQLAVELTRLRGPLRTFEIGMQVGSGLRRHATVISMVALPILAFAGRRLTRGAGALMRLGRKATRWWSFWKVGSAVIAGWGRGRRR